MFNSKTLINVGALLLILLVAYFGYRAYFGSSSTPSAGVAVLGPDGQPVTSPTETVDADAARFLALLQSVKNIEQTINDRFIQDRFYVSLRDYTVPVPARPLSRANPFLTIGLGGSYNPSGGAGTGSINLNFSTTSTESAPAGLPTDSGQNISPDDKLNLLKALQQQ